MPSQGERVSYAGIEEERSGALYRVDSASISWVLRVHGSVLISSSVVLPLMSPLISSHSIGEQPQGGACQEEIQLIEMDCYR